MAGQGTAATALLTRQGIPYTVHTYDHDPRHGSYGAEAAEDWAFRSGGYSRPSSPTWTARWP